MLTPVYPAVVIKRHSTASVLGRAYAMNNGWAANPSRFTNPNPPLSALQAQIAKVEAAEKDACSGIKGAAKKRNLEREKLISMLQTGCDYVRTVCEASPDEADVIIQSAGLVGAAAPISEHSPLKAVPGAVSGTADLDAAIGLLMDGRIRRSKVVHWQWTTDGGQTFHDAPTTPTGKTTIANLQPFTLVGFRVKVVTAKSPGEWTPIITILIH